MYISRLRLKNFRNFQNLDRVFSQGFVVLVGANGAGKTNFLEGIYFGSSLRRFPESDFGQLFLDGQDHFRVGIDFETEEKGSLEAFSQRGKNSYRYKFTVNGQVVPRKQFMEGLSVISFLPQDLNLLTRSPEGRRRYLDEALALTSSEYRHSLFQYQKALRQRNETLTKVREGEADTANLEVWDEQCAKFGSLITLKRQEFLKHINRNIVAIMNRLSPNLKSAAFIYKNSGPVEQRVFLEELRLAQEREVVLGVTTIGPHRDDFEVKVSQKVARGYVSRGELRGITLALKILERNYLATKLGREPVLLLDDVFSEFDTDHQQKLVEFLKSLVQVFITTTHLEEVKSFLPDTAQVYNVEDREVKKIVE